MIPLIMSIKNDKIDYLIQLIQYIAHQRQGNVSHSNLPQEKWQKSLDFDFIPTQNIINFLLLIIALLCFPTFVQLKPRSLFEAFHIESIQFGKC